MPAALWGTSENGLECLLCFMRLRLTPSCSLACQCVDARSVFPAIGFLPGVDHLFDPTDGIAWHINDGDPVVQIIELIDEFPQSLPFSGKYSSRFCSRKSKVNTFYYPLFCF